MQIILSAVLPALGILVPINLIAKLVADYLIGIGLLGQYSSVFYSVNAILFLVLTITLYRQEQKQNVDRQTAEDTAHQLQWQNSRLLNIVNSIDQAAVALDQNGRIVFMNPSAETLTGWGFPCVDDKKLSDIIALTDQNGRAVSVENVINGPDSTSGLYYVISNTGKKTPVEQNISEVFAPDGTTLGKVLIFKDLSSIDNSCDAYDFAGIGVMKYTIDGTIVDIDERCLHLLDLEDKYPDTGKVIGRKLNELTVYSKSFRRVQREILRKGDVHGLEYSIVTLQGRQKWLLHDSRIVVDRESGEKVIKVILRDITLRKLAQINLEEKSFYLEGILKSTAQTAIIATDTIFKIKYFNQAAETIFGYRAENAVGKSLMEIHGRDKLDPTGFDKAIEAVKMNCDYRYQLARKIDGKERQFDFTIRGLRRHNGRLAGYIVIAHDITHKDRFRIELKRGEESLRSNDFPPRIDLTSRPHTTVNG